MMEIIAQAVRVIDYETTVFKEEMWIWCQSLKIIIEQLIVLCDATIVSIPGNWS